MRGPRKSQISADYEALAEVRYQLRRFLHFSEQTAREAGLEPQQHQLMLALKGLPQGARPRVSDLAERLQIKHHSAVELINRLSSAGCVRRHRGGEGRDRGEGQKKDRREVLIALTARGERILRELSIHHRAELRKRGPALIMALKRAMSPARTDGETATNRTRNKRSGNQKKVESKRTRA